MLLVPGDCPLLDPKELEELLAHPAGERSALIIPDRHGTGTNALLLAPRTCSRRASVLTAASVTWPTPTRLACRREVVELSSLALDVDTPEDLEALHERLMSTRGGAALTRGMLNQLMRASS